MTILVTGGAGFIGSNFVLTWVSDVGSPVVNLDILTYAGNTANLDALTGDRRHVFVQGDICDTELVASLLRTHQPRAIVHFAAESHVDRSIAAPDAFIRTNVNGTFSILEATRAYWKAISRQQQAQFRFLHVSTDEVYGSLDRDDPPVRETAAFSPNSPYAASKAAADHLVRAYHSTYGLPTIISRCSNNYGPHQYPEKLVPLVIQNALCGKILPIYGDGEQRRDWLHVGDHCRALRLMVDSGVAGEVYNIGARNEVTNNVVVQSICKILDRLRPRSIGSHAALIEHVADRAGHDRRYAMDIDKAFRQLRWAPSLSFSAGLESTVEWYLCNQQWVSGLRKRGERERHVD